MTDTDATNEAMARAIRNRVGADKRIVFVSGNFNVVHPGHLRLLNFAAECADRLIVGVHRDGDVDTVLPGKLRLESVQGIGVVNEAVLLPSSATEFIHHLRPDIVVKGKEHQIRFNPEERVVESYGGRLLFSSGEAQFSSLDLLRRELELGAAIALNKPVGYQERHGFDTDDLAMAIAKFNKLRVLVVGDLIVDEYITCEPLGLSAEDPTIVVTPLQKVRFLGGAGIVAAHARGLGGTVSYVSIVGTDETAEFARERLDAYGVSTELFQDDSRPTTLKQRFRAREKTLLRVSHLKQHDIPPKIAKKVVDSIKPRLEETDLLIFSDFNYGCLPQSVVDEIVKCAQAKGVMMVADSQSSSQIGDISRFRNMALVTPTEREARLALRDNDSGLVTLANKLRSKAGVENVILTLGAEGVLIHAPTSTPDALITDRIPAMNAAPKDVAGAGDCLLTCTAMGLAVGTSIWQCAYLGSVAAACQVGRVGNSPLYQELLLSELYR